VGFLTWCGAARRGVFFVFLPPLRLLLLLLQVGALVNKQEALEAFLGGVKVSSELLTGRADGE